MAQHEVARRQEGQDWTFADIEKGCFEEAISVVWAAYLKSVVRQLESVYEPSIHLKITEYESRILMPPQFTVLL